MSEFDVDADWIRKFSGLIGMNPDSPSVTGFLSRLHGSYLERATPEEAAFDRLQLELIYSGMDSENTQAWSLAGEPPGADMKAGPDLSLAHRIVFAPLESQPPGIIRLKRFGAKAAELSTLVHVLDSFGLAVVEDFPSRLPGPNSGTGYIHFDDMLLRWTSQGEIPLSFDAGSDGRRVAEALVAVDEDRNEIDSLNRLALSAKLTFRQVALLRAYRCYGLQLSSAFPAGRLDASMLAFPQFTRALVEYFEAKFDPLSKSRETEVASARSQVLSQLEPVANFSQDQILRGFLELVDDTVRTNYFLSSDVITLKFAPSDGQRRILRRSLLETFVCAKDIMGIHLRAGMVARGGIRWSERIQDFRTEIYDLAQSQIKKNAIIVPTGAKGGFVVRSAARPHPEQIENAYKAFIHSLLEIEDNFVDGAATTPRNVVCFDSDDHYLVVAADKGTASFSDLANAISAERGYWLGDAFASGGSHGYDHKALAITARGAWSSARRHFRRLEMDIDNEPFKVIGVGDMSGDIFGNGMLQSDKIQLVAAFDHHFIFLDPNPDPKISFNERRRMASLENSSWADYDTELISDGGGVWPRHLKEISLPKEVRELLGLASETVSPPALISAILAAPADLIWFGGIGTYIRDKEESAQEIGDSQNDAVRITADNVRARVIVEGANLAVSQRARIRYSRRGGQINTDFLDNAGGVAMSDYEVNLKILLDLAVREGALDASDRDLVLNEVSDEAVQKVLRQVEDGVIAIDRDLPSSARDLDSYEALIKDWERFGNFDREIDSLPDAEEFAKRRAAKAGMTRPELAVIQAYAKSDLARALQNSEIAAGPQLFDLVTGYFPASTAARFRDIIPKHPLLATIAATTLASEVINRMGVVWAHELADELGFSLEAVAGAFWIAFRQVNASELWPIIDHLEDDVPGDQVLSFHRSLAATIDELTRMHLRQQDGPSTPGQIEQPGSATSMPAHPAQAIGGEAPEIGHSDMRSALAEHLDVIRRVPDILEIEEISRQSHREPDEVAEVMRKIDQAAHVIEIEQLLRKADRRNRWASWQINGFLDDLKAWKRRAALSILAEAQTSRSDEALERWTTSNQPVFDKAASLLGASTQSTGDEMTFVWLAMKELRSVR